MQGSSSISRCSIFKDQHDISHALRCMSQIALQHKLIFRVGIVCLHICSCCTPRIALNHGLTLHFAPASARWLQADHQRHRFVPTFSVSLKIFLLLAHRLEHVLRRSPLWKTLCEEQVTVSTALRIQPEYRTCAVRWRQLRVLLLHESIYKRICINNVILASNIFLL